MIKIYIPYLMNVIGKIEAIDYLPSENTKFINVMNIIYDAHGAIYTLHRSSVFYPYLRSSWTLANEMISLLETQTQNHDFQRDIQFYEIHQLKTKATEYKIALTAEFGALDAYFVTRKAAYDTWALLNSGETLFPASLLTKAPEAAYDAREAAKCLAFETPTASGFHTFRATESVLRRYYHHVTGGNAPPKVRNIAVYINALRQAKVGDEKILSVLKQMSDLHRNPLIHPEAVLTMDEAVAIIGIAQSAVTSMLIVLPELPPTTSSGQLPFFVPDSPSGGG
ncbi:hypothetical protein [Acidocella sp.]|uniref:hypothetical protein n=1 Tax=Acidocella sp. TaxID=50710 RepID=UPI00263870F7|nr:hypothetical protein [Acidocella sp.]